MKKWTGTSQFTLPDTHLTVFTDFILLAYIVNCYVQAIQGTALLAD